MHARARRSSARIVGAVLGLCGASVLTLLGGIRTHAQGGTVLNPGNGHYYEAIAGQIGWDGARIAATAMSYQGCSGHLATITSQAENNFLAATFPQAAAGPGNRDYYWLGGFQPPPFEQPGPDPDPTAGWMWVTGEAFTFTNWTAGEPNDSSARAENVLSFWHPSGSGRWNDLPDILNGAPLLQAGYIVEYSCVFAEISIKPDDDPNPINLKSKGVIPVAVLSTVDFDATSLDVSTVAFGPSGAVPAHGGHIEDVNGDGLDDMLFHFRTQQTGISSSDTEACLVGQTTGGEIVLGCDAIVTVPHSP